MTDLAFLKPYILTDKEYTLIIVNTLIAGKPTIVVEGGEDTYEVLTATLTNWMFKVRSLFEIELYVFRKDGRLKAFFAGESNSANN